MKNTNYNILKLLHNQLDDLWRIERHYLGDAAGASCDCPKLLESMRNEMKKNIEALKKELAKHHEADQLS